MSNYRIYGKLPSMKRYKAIDIKYGVFASKLIYADVFPSYESAFQCVQSIRRSQCVESLELKIVEVK